MADLAYLDTLPNAQLRAKCQEYGLPNVPVTDSSRGVLVRKLRSVMLGTDAKKTKRRETIHTTKLAEKSPNNINTRSATSHSPSRLSNDYKNNNTRRTIAAPPTAINPPSQMNNSQPNTKFISKTITVPMDVDYIYEDDKEQKPEETYKRYSNASNVSTTTVEDRNDPRLRRSVSLSKSGVMTTSYSQETVPLRTYMETDEPDSDQENLAQLPRYTVQSSQRPDQYTSSDYAPTFERRYVNTRPNLTKSKLNTISYSDYDQPTSTAATDATQRSLFNLYSSPLNYSKPTTQNRSPGTSILRQPLRASFAPTSAPTLYPKLNDFYEQPPAEEHDDVDEAESSTPESDYEEEEAAYESKFTRNLSSSSSNSPLARSSPQVRRGLTRKNEESIKEPLRQFLSALERKYHLKQSLAILLVVVIAIFIYVMLS